MQIQQRPYALLGVIRSKKKNNQEKILLFLVIPSLVLEEVPIGLCLWTLKEFNNLWCEGTIPIISVDQFKMTNGHTIPG